MAMIANMSGTRLAYVVRALPGTVKRTVCKWTKEDGLTTEEVEQPAGFIVYFPRGHALRFKNTAELARYGLDKKPKMINLQGLYDPESPAGKIMHAQDDEGRQEGFSDLEQSVIALATAKTGSVLMPEQLLRRNGA